MLFPTSNVQVASLGVCHCVGVGVGVGVGVWVCGFVDRWGREGT